MVVYLLVSKRAGNLKLNELKLWLNWNILLHKKSSLQDYKWLCLFWMQKRDESRLSGWSANKAITILQFWLHTGLSCQFYVFAKVIGCKEIYKSLDVYAWGTFIKDVPLFWSFFEIPTYPCPILSYFQLHTHKIHCIFWQTYLPPKKVSENKP